MAPKIVDMADRTKKRKRTAENPIKPSKKTTIEGSHGTVKVSIHEAERWAPVVGKWLQKGIAMDSASCLLIPNSFYSGARSIQFDII